MLATNLKISQNFVIIFLSLYELWPKKEGTKPNNCPPPPDSFERLYQSCLYSIELKLFLCSISNGIFTTNQLKELIKEAITD